MDKKKVIWEAHNRGLHDGFINFWMGMLDDVLEDMTQELRIFEYGTLNSKFLEFIEIACPIKEGLGIVMPVDDKKNHHTWSKGATQHLMFSSESQTQPNHAFDIGFSQEVFSLIPDLSAHARYIWDMLSPSGVYYSAFGWHAENPCIARQQNLRNQKGLSFHLHTLDEVVHAFHAQGFEVGVKRLTLPYFMIYDPAITHSRYGSIEDMIHCQQDYKILFSFRKWETLHD
jgi:hypothetical protein